MEGNSTTPKNCVLTEFLHERSTIFLLVFSLKTILNFAQEWVFPFTEIVKAVAVNRKEK